MTIITQPYTFSDAKVKFNTILKDIKNIRTQRDPKHDQRLQERIHSKGLHLPMFIGKTDTKDQFILIFGHRRHDVLEEAGYGDKNPLIDCIIVAPSDDPDRPLTNEEIRDLRLDDEFFWLNVTDYDTLMAVAQKTEDELAKGKNISQIAREEFGKDESWVRKIRNAFRIVHIHNALKDGLISLHDSFNLLNIDEEAIKTLIAQRDTLTSRGFAEACKNARNGVSEPPASESVKESKEDIPEASDDDPRTVLINTIPEDLRERFTNDTKDFNLRDIERIVKLIEHGVVMHDAIRTVKLSQTETPQKTEKGEGELPVHDGEGGSTEEALLSPETDDIISKAFERGGEKGTEEAVLDESITSPDAMLTTQSPLPEEKVEVTPGSDPSPETKVIKFVNRMLRLGEATTTHMKEKELEALGDADYRKILKDYEEASFEIDGFRDFLHGRENNGSVQFNRAKRLHNAIREFDAHSISSINEATNLRSIKIETKKKLTKDVDILDNIINGKGGE